MPMLRFLGSTLHLFSCIDSLDCVFERMTPLKSTSKLTFSAAKSRKSYFSGHLRAVWIPALHAVPRHATRAAGVAAKSAAAP
jgi:hypothetical protein